MRGHRVLCVSEAGAAEAGGQGKNQGVDAWSPAREVARAWKASGQEFWATFSIHCGQCSMNSGLHSRNSELLSRNSGLHSRNHGLLWDIVACYFGPLGFPGTGLPDPVQFCWALRGVHHDAWVLFLLGRKTLHYNKVFTYSPL